MLFQQLSVGLAQGHAILDRQVAPWLQLPIYVHELWNLPTAALKSPFAAFKSSALRTCVANSQYIQQFSRGQKDDSFSVAYYCDSSLKASVF